MVGNLCIKDNRKGPQCFFLERFCLSFQRLTYRGVIYSEVKCKSIIIHPSNKDLATIARPNRTKHLLLLLGFMALVEMCSSQLPVLEV